MEEILLKIVDLVEKMGYIGIFIMTFVEGTLIPIPNEITLIPAGFLVSKGEFNLWVLLLVSALGNMAGALTSYYVALIYGRSLLIKYGRYFFFDEGKMLKIEKFFVKHGAFSVFIGRIAPGVKHFISFPAGLAKMDLWRFVLYSGVGGTVWVTLLIVIGMLIGNNQEMISYYVEKLNTVFLLLIPGVIISYALYNRRRQQRLNEMAATSPTTATADNAAPVAEGFAGADIDRKESKQADEN